MLEIYTNWILFTVSVVINFAAVELGFSENPGGGHYPRPQFMPSETNFTFHQGDTAVLLCGVMNLGTKTVTWRRDSALQPLAIGEMIFSQNTGYEIHHPENSFYWNLLIKNVQPEHADVYECQISTKDKMLRRMQLNVLDDKRSREPVINISGLLHVDKGQSIKLLCNATGTSAPPDVIDWFKDGLQLQSNEKKLVSIKKKFSYPDKTMTSELEIQNAQMSDKGTYTCRTSDLQVTSVNVNVLNAEKPKSKRDEEQLQAQKTRQFTGGVTSFHDSPVLLHTVSSVILSLYIMFYIENR